MNLVAHVKRVAIKLHLLRSIVRCLCTGENAYWIDCPKHGEGCAASTCLMCGELEYADCEYWNDRRY